MSGALVRAACFAVLACSVFAADSAGKTHVLTVTHKTLADAIATHDKLIVDFYLPTCSSCRQLEPEWEKSAAMLEADGIILAKFDSSDDQSKAINTKYIIQGFPTLKIFRGNDKAEEYKGPKDAEGIAQYARKVFGPISTLLTTKAEVDALADSELVVLGIFANGTETPEYKAFQSAAETLLGDTVFSHVTSPALVADCSDCVSSTILAYKNWEPRMTKYTGDFISADIVKFVDTVTTPELVEMNRVQKNQKPLNKIFESHLPKLIGVASANDDSLKEFKDNLIAISKAHEKIHVVFADPEENEGAMQFFGVSGEELPALLFHEPLSDIRRIVKNVELSAMMEQVNAYSRGEIPKVVKSEPVPETNDGPVFQAVGDTLAELLTSGKDVLIQFKAPWCTHCKAMATHWERVGRMFNTSANVVIAEMDGSKNDVPDIPEFPGIYVGGYPTVLLIRASDKSIHRYSGKRYASDFQKFILDNLSPESVEGANLVDDTPKSEMLLKRIMSGEQVSYDDIDEALGTEEEPEEEDDDEYETPAGPDEL